MQATPSVNFVWDAQRPRLLSMTDGVSTTTYTYHQEGALGGGKLASETSSLGVASTLTYLYDELGRLDSRAIGASNEFYEYDTLGRIQQIDNDLGSHMQAYLGSTGQLTQSTVGSIQTNFSYGSNQQDRQLAAISTTSSAGFSSVRDYQRDVLGRITAASETRQVTPSMPTMRNFAFDYNDHDRLATWTDTSSSSALESFAYDDSGNLLQQVRGGTTWNAVANGDNQLVSADGNAWDYDLVGNLIDDGQRTYLWDAENRLVKITNITTGATSEFSYDGLGRRVMSTERASSSALPVTSYYQWCDSEICQKRDSSQSVAATYLAQGEVHGSTLLYYVRDQLGSPREVLNQLGNSVGTLEYGSYGRSVSASGLLPDKLYAGMYYHDESGLYLTWHRAYEPRAGRWISRDPIGLSGGVNTYAYVEGDPIGGVDPLGLVVNVVESNPRTARALMVAYGKLNARSATARFMNSHLEQSATVYEIRYRKDSAFYCSDGRSPECNGQSNTIFIDPCYSPKIATTAGMQRIPLPIMLAHELGHAFGYNDNVSATNLTGDNIDMIENPVRREFGLPLRISYSPPVTLPVVRSTPPAK